MNAEIKSLIEQNMMPGDFTHAKINDTEIAQAEDQLSLKFPVQYTEFLKEYGHGGIGGIETLGMGLNGKMISLDMTVYLRRKGLPQNLIAIDNQDEWVYCIDADTERIVSWDMSGMVREEFACFDDYLLNSMMDAIENL